MNNRHSGVVRVGTSGIVLPGHKTTFPPEFQTGTRLHYYGSLFDTLEINSSFYKIPQYATFKKWADEVPENFAFTVKLWRGITHAKDLVYSPHDLMDFMQAADGLGAKKGCLLVQFPASISLDYWVEVEKILQGLAHYNQQNQWQLAVEFRHNSWYQEKVYEALVRYNAVLVLHDMPKSATPVTYLTSWWAYSRSVYLRFHGPTGQYNGCYADRLIDDYAEQINNWCKSGKDVYVYFNNTLGAALDNAQYLQGRLAAMSHRPMSHRPMLIHQS